MSAAPRYHPDKILEETPQTDPIRRGTNPAAGARALRMKKARAYIAAHPGCRTTEIFAATQCWGSDLNALVKAKLIKFTMPKQADGHRPLLYTVVEMQNPE